MRAEFEKPKHMVRWMDRPRREFTARQPIIETDKHRDLATELPFDPSESAS